MPAFFFSHDTQASAINLGEKKANVKRNAKANAQSKTIQHWPFQCGTAHEYFAQSIRAGFALTSFANTHCRCHCPCVYCDTRPAVIFFLCHPYLVAGVPRTAHAGYAS